MATIGLCALLEGRARLFILLALKGLRSWDADEFAENERKSTESLEKELLTTSGRVGDPQLVDLTRQWADQRRSISDKRNAVVHALWAFGPDGQPTGIDIRRQQELTAAQIEDSSNAAILGEALAHSIVMRVASLILAGSIPGSVDQYGWSVRVGEQFVRL